MIKLLGDPFEGSRAEIFLNRLYAMSTPHPLDPQARILDNCSVLCQPIDGNKVIHISAMDSLIRGSGSLAIRKLCDLADEVEIDLSLHAFGYADVPTAKLVDWYQRYGFVKTGVGSDREGWRMKRSFVPQSGQRELDLAPRIVKLRGFNRPH